MIRTPITLAFILLSFLHLSAESNKFRFKKINMDNGLSYNSALCLHQDKEDNIWIGTRDGLNKYNGIDNQIFKQSVENSYSLSNSHINCIFESSKGELWIGTAYGLSLYKGNEEFDKFFTQKY